MSAAFLTVLLTLINHYGEPNSDIGALPTIMRHPTIDAAIVCDRPVHDFGTVWGAQDLLPVFEIRNEGTATAYLRFSMPPHESWTFKIEPKETMLLPVPLSTHDLQGHFEKQATLTFVVDVAEMRCSSCGEPMHGEDHMLRCGSVCREPRPDKFLVGRRSAPREPDAVDFAILNMLWASWSRKPVEPPVETGAMRHPVLDATIVCDEPVHDFGTVWGAQELRHVFEVRNEGTDSALLRRSFPPASSCHFIIEPCETVFIPIMLRSEKFRGNFNKRINLTFVENVDEMICAHCGRWMSGQEHIDRCGAICLEPMSSEGCVQYERPAWAHRD